VRNLDLFYSKGDYSLPSSVVVEQESLDGLHNAQILYEDSSKAYYFAVQRKQGTRLIVDSSFVPRSYCQMLCMTLGGDPFFNNAINKL